ncbi:MAG: hypothetical protein JXQ29_09440 [Planctomycetes bacterium]|nr:hypothetical protein [Planctomycetota bacterium]
MLERAPFCALLLGAVLALLPLSGCSAVVSSEPQASDSPLLDDIRPLGSIQEEDPQSDPQSEEARRKLMDERRQVLMQAYLEDARKLMLAGQLDRAESTLLEALKSDPLDPQARQMLKEVQERLGKRTGEVESLAEREATRQKVRQEANYARVRQALQQGREAMDAGNFREAARAYELAGNIMTWNPLLGEKEPDLKDQAMTGLRRAGAALRDQDNRLADQALAEAYQKRMVEEQRDRARQDLRLRAILEQATQRFEENRFAEAEQLTDQILEEEPTHLEARKLRDTIRDARHHYLDARYLKESKERFKRWSETIATAKIPSSAVLEWPTQTFWDRINRDRKVYAPVYGGEDSVAVQNLKNKLKTETIPLQFESANLKDVLDWIRSFANIPIVIDSEIVEELQSADLGFPLNLEKVKVGVALDTVMAAKPEFGYTFKHDVIYVTRKEKAAGTPIPVVHDVRDLTIPIQDFTPPQIRLKAAGADMDSSGIFGRPAEENPPAYNPEDLMELIKGNISTRSWEEGEVSIDLVSGRLLVIHNPDVQNKIQEFLNNLRSFTTSIVTVEARFITVRDNFLEDIGVDWRGLGGAGQKGPLAVLDDVTSGAQNMASAGLDNGGTGLPINNLQSPAAGAFFNDGEDGDVRARTENLFDNLIGNMLSPVGGLTLSFAWLDDTQVNIILRAVEKSERATLLTAPRLTVYNTQRSNITLVNQISYIKDYDVEVAQTASIADPVVGIIQDGLVLDVRPTISNDRRFVTLELRPTVANLIQPIRTITTTLGSQTQPVTIQLPEIIVQSAETTVTVPDRGTVVIGGLKNILSVDRRSEIPFLADIPILGFLFSRKARSDESADLIIIVTVHISDLKEQEEMLRR